MSEDAREATMKRKAMLDGRELSEPELDEIRQEIEDLQTIDVISHDMRALIEQQWPHLLAKIRPATRHTH